MEMSKIKNKFDEERIFLIGNGPSLSKTPLDKLSKEYTFAVNNIHNIYSKTEWRPDFYMATHTPNEGIDSEAIISVCENETLCFLSKKNESYFGYRENIGYFNTKRLEEVQEADIDHNYVDWESVDDMSKVWSENITNYVMDYWTVLFPAVQVIRYMGFSEIYLLGCDLYETAGSDIYMVFESGSDPVEYQFNNSIIEDVTRYLNRSDSPIRSLVNLAVFKIGISKPARMIEKILANQTNILGDRDYFYDSDTGVRFTNKISNHRMRLTHKLMNEASSYYGFSIYNATYGGRLEEYQRVNLEDVLED